MSLKKTKNKEKKKIRRGKIRWKKTGEDKER